MDRRSPLEGFLNIFNTNFAQNYDKPVKQALYNAVAIFLLILSCAALWALYLILEPFIKPLIWAALVGSVLHPLKRSLRDTLLTHFERMEETKTPVFFGVVLMPISIIDNTSEIIGNVLYKHIKLIAAISVLLPLIPVCYFYTPRVLILVFWRVVWVFDVAGNYILCLSSFYTISIGTCLYLTSVYILWTPENNAKFHYFSIMVWSFISLSISNQFGSFGLPIFLTIQLIIFAGFLNEVYTIYTNRNCEANLNLIRVLKEVFHGETHEISTSDHESDETEPEQVLKTVKFSDEIKEESLKIAPKKRVKFQRSLSQPQINCFNPNFLQFGLNYCSKLKEINTDNSKGSTFYLYILIWACCGMIFWKNIMLIPLILLPVFVYITKHFGHYLGVWKYLHNHMNSASNVVGIWCETRQNALIPTPIRIFYRILSKFNVFIGVSMKNSVDTVSSCFVILALIVFCVTTSIFMVLQIYAEAIMLVQITSNVINQTVVHNPELSHLIPFTLDDTVDSILDNAYVYGREGISKSVKSLMADVDEAKSSRIEKQILEIWDRVYQSWMSSNQSNAGPVVTQDAVASSWESFVNDIKKSPEMFNGGKLIDFAKQNLGTLLSLLDSLWSIVKGNINLILSSLGAFLSIVLGGGSAVMNFILNLVVFLTTLFYLLNSSGKLYRPVEIMTNFSPSGSRFGLALEGAINSVFAASFKMAAFYGLWTWFIHNLFGVRIVYLPSAVAMILGAVPFLGTYWAGVPAFLDLWLAQDRGFSALIFAIFQFLPISIVDTTIYKEIRGGHPYLTGLAIAGGVFCSGVEGAIIGPILLCGLYVVMDLSSNLFKESPTNVPMNVRMRMFKD